VVPASEPRLHTVPVRAAGLAGVSTQRAVLLSLDLGLPVAGSAQISALLVAASKLRVAGVFRASGHREGDIKTPFGGYKQSGSMARDNGTEALEQYLQTKTIWINMANA